MERGRGAPSAPEAENSLCSSCQPCCAWQRPVSRTPSPLAKHSLCLFLVACLSVPPPLPITPPRPSSECPHPHLLSGPGAEAHHSPPLQPPLLSLCAHLLGFRWVRSPVPDSPQRARGAHGQVQQLTRSHPAHLSGVPGSPCSWKSSPIPGLPRSCAFFSCHSLRLEYSSPSFYLTNE